MKNMDQLIEYVQRELNTKRFLDESLGFLEGLRDAKTAATEADKAKTRAVADKVAKEADLAAVNDAVDAAKAQLATLAEEAKALSAVAALKAADIVAKAEEKAAAQLAEVQEQLDKVLEEIKSAQVRQKSIIKENMELSASTNRLQDGLDALKKKLG